MVALGWGGGFSDHIVVPRSAVYKIPDSVSLEVGGKLLEKTRKVQLM